MNKTIIININGIVFHIEEDAYEFLKSYMTDVKRHFSTSADSLEITTDIENRIAEMFSDILIRDNKQVVIEQDVKWVLEQMGTVADFENAETDHAPFNTPLNTESRRLYRDPDDHLVGGVAAGIANYFDIDAVWVRLAFALFTPIGGSGFLLYIILWIVVPKAVTRADRMAMKGQKQNLQGFAKNFEEELGSVKQNLSNFGLEARPFVYKARDFAGDFFHHFGIFLAGTGRVLVKLFGIVVLFWAFGFTIFLIVAFVALVGFGRFTPLHDLPINMLQHNHADLIYISAFLVAFIPVLSIIMLTLKGIFNTGNINRSTGSTILVIWLVSVGVLVYYCVEIASYYKTQARFTETVSIKPVKNNTYYLKLNDLKYFTHEDSTRLNIKLLAPNIQITDDPNDDNDFDFRSRRNVHLYIEKSDVNKPVLVQAFTARGRNYEEAFKNAQNIKYIFTQQDTVLKFDYRLYATKNELWHNEELYLTLKIPMNAKVIIDQDLERMVDGVDIYDCKNINKQERASTATFVMTENGLQCKIDTLVISKKDSLKTAQPADSTQTQ